MIPLCYSFHSPDAFFLSWKLKIFVGLAPIPVIVCLLLMMSLQERDFPLLQKLQTGGGAPESPNQWAGGGGGGSLGG
jgi:hypothetical protein